MNFFYNTKAYPKYFQEYPDTVNDLNFDVIDISLSKFSSWNPSYVILPPLIKETYYLYYQERIEYSPIYFLLVFNLNFWISIIFILIFTLIFLYLHSKFIQKINFIDKFFYITTLTGDEMQINSFSLKMCVIIFSIFTIIISGIFSGFLSAEIAIAKSSLPFKTLSEMADQSKYIICNGRNDASLGLLKRNTKFAQIINTKQCSGLLTVLNDMTDFNFDEHCKDPYRTFFYTKRYMGSKKKLLDYDR